MNIENGKEILIISPEEHIDFGNSNDIKEEIKRNIHPNISKLVLDLGKVNFIDSSGAGMLISLLKFMTQRHGQIALCNLQKEVAFVIRITKLDSIFKTFDSREQALKFLEA